MENETSFGAMIDCSRNAVMKPEKVKELARILKGFGYQSLLLYTEDTFEVGGEPYFGFQRGRYTRSEIQDMDSYCRSIGIELVPCVELLAHLNQIFRWEIYQRIRDSEDVLFVGEEQTYTLIEHIFQSLRAAYSSNKVHIGFDEASGLGKGLYKQKHGDVPVKQILFEHLARVLEIAKKYDFEPLMWADMFFDAEAINYYKKNHDLPEEIKGKIPSEVALVNWAYGNPWVHYNAHARYVHGMDGVEQFKDLLSPSTATKNKLYYAGGLWCWTGFAPHNRYAIPLMKNALEACQEVGIHNIYMTLWGDNGKECSYFSCLPALFMIKKQYDGETDEKKLKADFKRITGEDYDAMLSLDEPNYLGTESTTWIQNPSRWGVYMDPFYRMLDTYCQPGVEKEYEKWAKRYEGLAKKSPYSTLFHMEAALSHLLSLRFVLGRKTAEAYQKKDKKALQGVLPLYDETIKALHDFYLAERALWYFENKTNGFEILAIRLGGCEERLRDCKDLLERYLAGKIDKIEELEQPTMDFLCLDHAHRMDTLFFDSWMMEASPNQFGH
jgi:hexosaminidase